LLSATRYRFAQFWAKFGPTHSRFRFAQCALLSEICVEGLVN
jgi:hypothetical protein